MISPSVGDFGRMEILPVLEVVEVDGIENRSGVGDPSGLEDTLAGFVVVIVTHDGGVVSIDRLRVEGASFLIEDPLFTLSVGGLFFANVGEESIALDAEGVEGHLVVTGARSGVVGMQLADRIERGFLPEAGEVKDAKRAGDAGGDEGDDLAHVR